VLVVEEESAVSDVAKESDVGPVRIATAFHGPPGSSATQPRSMR